MTSAAAESSPHDAMSYEELVDALEQLTQRMADGEIGIEEAAELYEEAKRLEESARQRLDRVRRRIETLAQDGGVASP
jgi:exodeoxyribonuclease VII small subunit